MQTTKKKIGKFISITTLLEMDRSDKNFISRKNVHYTMNSKFENQKEKVSSN